jgi:hypothetical protein
MSEWDRIADIRRFRPDMMDIEELDRQILEDKLIRELEVRYASVGLGSDFSNLAFALGGDLILHQDDDGETWTLLKDTGWVDDDTDNTIYDEIATETSEEWLAKLLDLDDSDYPVANNPRVAKKVIRDSKGRKIPDRYLEGYKGKRLEERIQEIEERRDEYKALLAKYGDESDFPKRALQKLYRRFESDQGVKDKRSNYTKEAQRRGFVGSLEDKAELASDYYGVKVPLSILKTVNARGMAAWASGGHRPGQTSHSWGIARVNSFLVGGKTFFTADADLAKKLSKKLREAIEDERVW